MISLVVPSLRPMLVSGARTCGTSTASSTSIAALPLRLLQFRNRDGTGNPRVGAQLADPANRHSLAAHGEIVDVTASAPTIGRDMKKLLESGRTGQQAVIQAIESGKHRLDIDNVQLCAPILNPPKIMCVGLNYRDHCAEMKFQLPKEPTVFCKLSNALAGPSDDVIIPPETVELDFEAELAVVIGKKGHRIPVTEALSHVAGYTVAHDVSARDWQLKKNSGQWLLGKSFDGFCPLGPVIATPAMLSDPGNLGIRSRVNGVTMQDSNTNQMVHKVDTIIAFISRFVTLVPGDVILTGSPAGVGASRVPPVWLKKGDVVECEIDEIGAVKNSFV